MTNQPDKTQTPATADRKSPFPTAQTLYRVVGLRKDFERILQSTFRATAAQPTPEEALATRHILNATAPVDLVRLAPISRGVVQLFWIQRMDEAGVAALPFISRRLKSCQSIDNEDERRLVVERLVSALKRLGEPGAQALLACFNNLDDYGQSMAAVTLGAMRVAAAANPIWRFFQRAKKASQAGYFVGALWGLIDLGDARAAEALAELLAAEPEQLFAELYPFAALAGDGACVGPLTARFVAALEGRDHYDGERDDILMALAAIGQRIGQDEYKSLLHGLLESEDSANLIAKVAVERAPQEVAHYFQMYTERPFDDLAA